MAKEKKKNDAGKNGKKTGRRFGNRREDYVDSFRWGFVDGEENQELEPDDELFLGKEQREEKAPDRADKSASKKEKNAGKAKPKNAAGTADSNSKGGGAKAVAAKTSTKSGQSRKKGPNPPAQDFNFFDDEDDDDDLNLPSYGRTPVPTDAELPQPVAKPKSNTKKKDRTHDAAKGQKNAQKPKQQAPAKASTPKQEKNAQPAIQKPVETQDFSDLKREESVQEEPVLSRPRKEQMVWDPNKMEYVPLIIPTPIIRTEKPAEKSKQKDKPAGNSEQESKQKNKKSKETKRSSAESVQEPASSTRRAGADADSKGPTTRKPVKADHSPETRGQQSTAHEKSSEETATPKRKTKKSSKKSGSKKSTEVQNPSAGTKAESADSIEQTRKVPPQRPPKVQRGDFARMPEETGLPDLADVESDVPLFAAMGVSDIMLEALKIARYIEPTPIQSGVFNQVKAGTDVMGQAQTGTGKTAAFSIPLIEGIEDCPPGDDPVALILVPTRELAVQVRDEVVKLSYGREVRVAACYGGKPIAKQMTRLRDGMDIIVGTPGRILDLMKRAALKLDSLRWVVLDEADRMLDIGFRPDIEKILRKTPQDRQTLLFSATLPAPVVRLAEKYMREPVILDFSNKGVAVDTIEQYYVTVDPERKFDALLYLLDQEQPNQAIIFTRTKRGADRLARLLSKRLDQLAAIHGDLSQGDRDRVMSQFRAGKIRYLVATDVVGRGIDVSGISHIINYDIPAFCDDYVHRVGRTGRMGREGVAFTFVTVQEGSELTRIEMRIDKLLKRADLKGFESFAKPVSMEEEDSDTPESKPVFGKHVRKIRRAL